MYPPFYPNGPRAGDLSFDPFEDKRTLRRGAPEALRLTLPPPGAPFVTYVATRPPDIGPPAGQKAHGGLWHWVRQLRLAPHV